MYSVLKWIYMLNFFFWIVQVQMHYHSVYGSENFSALWCRTTRIEYAFGSIICLVSELHFFSCHVVFLYLCSRMFNKYDQVIWCFLLPVFPLPVYYHIRYSWCFFPHWCAVNWIAIINWFLSQKIFYYRWTQIPTFSLYTQWYSSQVNIYVKLFFWNCANLYICSVITFHKHDHFFGNCAKLLGFNWQVPFADIW
jgi:hypothetical protein